MKVLVVSPKFHPIIGGGETFVINSVERLIKLGHDVQVAVGPNQNRRISEYKYPVHEVNGLCDLPLDPLAATDGLFVLLEDFRPDIIHVHGYFALLATYLANKANIPVLASIHSTPVWGERIVGGMSGFEQERLFAEKILKATLPKAVTAANEVYAVAARKLAKDVVPVIEFPYPILSEFYQQQDKNYYRKQFRLLDKDILLTVPSRIIERKGIREAVYALSKLPEHFYLCLPCAGAPNDVLYWNNIESSEQFKSVSERIIIPNTRILPEEMPSLYAASNIILMPSYYEGAPVATVEAMATKTPFIGADSQGINGFIRHLENGLLVPQKDPDALAEAITLVASDKVLAKSMAEQAGDDVLHLSWDHQQHNLVELYKSLFK